MSNESGDRKLSATCSHQTHLLGKKWNNLSTDSIQPLGNLSLCRRRGALGSGSVQQSNMYSSEIGTQDVHVGWQAFI